MGRPIAGLTAVGAVAIITVLYLAAAHRRGEGVQLAERGDLSTIALASAFAAGLAVAVADGPVAGSRSADPRLVAVGVTLLVAGSAVRIVARRQLARSFSVRLRTTSDQVLVTTGLYGRVRHPAYFGSLLVAVGLALALSSWLGAVLMLCGCFGALLFRIRREEALLTARFGREYEAYASRTKRLIPGVF